MTTAQTPLSISIGGRAFVVRPLTLGQIERVAAVIDEVVAGADRQTGQSSIATARRILSIGLEKSYPDDARDDCADIEAAIDDLFAASEAVLHHAGLKKAGPAPGESPPQV